MASNRGLRWVMSGALALAAIAGAAPAWAQSEAKETKRANIHVVDGDDAFVFELENGDIITATRNGKDIDRKRLEIRPGKLVFRGDDGSERVFETPGWSDDGAKAGAFSWTNDDKQEGKKKVRMHVIGGKPGEEGEHTMQWRLLGGDDDEDGGDDAEDEDEDGDEQPRVLIGVQLAQPGSHLARHFGLEPDKISMLSGVYRSLPAGKAGLRPYDLIIALDGSEDCSNDNVRRLLRGKNPGDEVEMKVLQKGEKRRVVVRVEPFDESRFDESDLEAIEPESFSFEGSGLAPGEYAIGLRGLSDGMGQFVGPEGGKWMIEMDGAREMAERARGLAEKERGHADEARKHAEEMVRRYTVRGGPGGQDQMILVEPRMLGGSGGGDRMESIEKRLEKLERLLERLAEQREEGGR